MSPRTSARANEQTEQIDVRLLHVSQGHQGHRHEVNVVLVLGYEALSEQYNSATCSATTFGLASSVWEAT